MHRNGPTTSTTLGERLLRERPVRRQRADGIKASLELGWRPSGARQQAPLLRKPAGFQQRLETCASCPQTSVDGCHCSQSRQFKTSNAEKILCGERCWRGAARLGESNNSLRTLLTPTRVLSCLRPRGGRQHSGPQAPRRTQLVVVHGGHGAAGRLYHGARPRRCLADLHVQRRRQPTGTLRASQHPDVRSILRQALLGAGCCRANDVLRLVPVTNATSTRHAMCSYRPEQPAVSCCSGQSRQPRPVHGIFSATSQLVAPPRR